MRQLSNEEKWKLLGLYVLREEDAIEECLSYEEESRVLSTGVALEKAGQIDEAIAHFEYWRSEWNAFAEREPATPGQRGEKASRAGIHDTLAQSMHRNLIALYKRARRYEEARQLCELAAKRWPGNTLFSSRPAGRLLDGEELAICQEGQRLEKAGRTNEAIALYEYGVTNETRAPFTYRRLLVLYRKAQRFEDERRLCEKAASRWPDVQDGYGNVSPSDFSSRLARINARLGIRSSDQKSDR